MPFHLEQSCWCRTLVSWFRVKSIPIISLLYSSVIDLQLSGNSTLSDILWFYSEALLKKHFALTFCSILQIWFAGIFIFREAKFMVTNLAFRGVTSVEQSPILKPSPFKILLVTVKYSKYCALSWCWCFTFHLWLNSLAWHLLLIMLIPTYNRCNM